MPATNKLSDRAIKTALKAAISSGKAKRIADGAGRALQAS